jgi:YidC/Oxa1 family membrane protein insertase
MQEKYKDNPQEQQKQMMELYKKYGVNPLSSCWPMMIQMPIFIALFWALRDPSFYLRLPGFEQATFFGTQLIIPPYISHPTPEIALHPGVISLYNLFHYGWFADKFIYLPTLWLVALYIATTIIQSKQMQAQSQAQSSGQPNISNMMMPMFVIIGMMFPVGLLVYFITSNALQMFQYYRIQREIAAEEAVLEKIGGTPGAGPNTGPPPIKRRKKKK